MGDKLPEQDSFKVTAELFEKRVAQREVLKSTFAPPEDRDLIALAETFGLSGEQILEACLLARRRLEAQTGLQLTNIDQTVIAKQATYSNN